MTHNMPENAEIVCMIREDFERNFGNDYISKDKIREKIEAIEEKSGHYFERAYAITSLQELLEEL